MSNFQPGNLCDLRKGAGSCSRRPGAPSVTPTYQQQIIAQSRSLGQLRRNFIIRKCREQRINERAAVKDISELKTCNPCATELEILHLLIQEDFCPETIIYQTYVVESLKSGQCRGAEETFQNLRQHARPKASGASEPERRAPGARRQVPGTRPPPKRQPSTARLPTAPKPQPSRPHTRPAAARQYQRNPMGTAPAPLLRQVLDTNPRRHLMDVTPPTGLHYPITPRRGVSNIPCQTPPNRQMAAAPCNMPAPPRTPPHQIGQRYPQAPPRPCSMRTYRVDNPEDTPVTRIPRKAPEQLQTPQRQQTAERRGSKIPCPVETMANSRRELSSRGESSSRKRISFGGTEVSYLEDWMPQGQTPQGYSDINFSPVDIMDPSKMFQEYKAMIEEEKKEIRDMHNIVTELIDRPEKVDFRDMYALVPGISLDETTAETAPEVAAAMLYSDEHGLSMKSPPAEVYNTLFRGGEKDRTIIQVKNEENTEGVVPISTEGFEAALLSYEQQGVFEELPPDTKFTLPEMPKPKGTSDKGEGEDKIMSSTLRDKDKKAMTKKELKQLEELKKAEADIERLSSIRSESDPLSDKTKYEVELQPQDYTRHDFIQIRGSQPPPWFPGYYVAMGDSPKINVVTKPWDVLEKTWRKLQPKKLKPDTGTYVLGI